MLPCEVCKTVLPLESEPAGGCDRNAGPAEVLIVEDDPDLAQDLTDRLTALNYGIVGIANCASAAIALAQARTPDLVLLDIQLSGDMDGIQVAGQMRKLSIPVVFVTGFRDGAVLDRAVSSEPYGYLVKPYETSDLKIAVQVALRRYRAERDRQKLLRRFQEVLGTVKTLGGRLSICCYCKKVKDSAGRWPEIETYVMEHSHASFTHGMCPDCFAGMKKKLEAAEAASGDSGAMIIG